MSPKSLLTVHLAQYVSIHDKIYVLTTNAQIQILAQTGNTTITPTPPNRAPLRRIGAASARVPSSACHILSNAFKALPTNARNTDDTPGDDRDRDDMNGTPVSNTTQSSTPVTDTSTAASSPCVRHVETEALRWLKGTYPSINFLF